MLGHVNRAINGLVVILGLVLLAMIALSFYNVVSRYVFRESLLWADEIAVFALIVSTWIGAVACAWRGLDIRMNIVFDMLPAGLRRPLALLQQLAIVVLCGWVAWLSWGYVARIARVGMTSDSARIPMWPIHSALTLSLALIAAVAAIRLVRLVFGASEHLNTSANRLEKTQ